METVVLGIGNPDRRDDGVGLRAVEKLRPLLAGKAACHAAWGEPTDLVSRLEGYRRAYLIDAVVGSGAPPGTLLQWDLNRGELPGQVGLGSSHALGLETAVELARVLGVLPEVTVVFGVEVRDTDFGRGLSPEVESALPELVARVLADVEG